MAISKDDSDKAIEAALDYVHPTEASFVKAFSQEFAISNMGQDIGDFVRGGYGTPRRPADLVAAAWSQFYGSSESDEMAAGLEDERKMWERDCKKKVLPVMKKKGLALTLRNGTNVWEKKE